jgi:SAM-dependent methyltransferase
MTTSAFDAYAERYDGWFLENLPVLESEVRLVAVALGKEPGRTLSVGCGTGLFEKILREDHAIAIRDGVEPSREMAEVARKRGLTVEIGAAGALPAEDGTYDTVLMNGTPGYIDDLEGAFREVRRVLKPGGHAVVADVPRESGYGLLYRLAAELGSWSHPALEGAAPRTPYPIELAGAARWRTTAEKTALLRHVGLEVVACWQTLTRHPAFSDESPEDPVEGFDRGDYVAIRARNPEPPAD